MHYKQFFIATACVLASVTTIFCTTATTAAPITIELPATDTEDDPDLDYLKDLNPDAPVALSALKEEPTLGKKFRMVMAVAKEKIKATSKRAIKRLGANKGKLLLGALGLGTTIAIVKLCTGGSNPPQPDDNDPKQPKK